MKIRFYMSDLSDKEIIALHKELSSQTPQETAKKLFYSNSNQEYIYAFCSKIKLFAMSKILLKSHTSYDPNEGTRVSS